MLEYLDSQLTQTLFNTVKHQQAIKSKVINAQFSPPPPPPPFTKLLFDNFGHFLMMISCGGKLFI